MGGPFGKQLRTVDPARIGGRPINNAALLGVRLYRTNLDVFDAWDRSSQGDLRIAVRRLAELLEDVEGAEAFRRMRHMLGLPQVEDSTLSVTDSGDN